MQKNITNFEIAKYFNYDDKMTELAQNIIENAQDDYENGGYDSIDDAVFYFINENLIYNTDRWTLIEYYFLPDDENISFYKACEYLHNDIMILINKGGKNE